MAQTEAKEPKQGTQDDAAPSKADLLRLKMKAITNYIAIGFAPIAAAAALAMAVVAIVATQSAQTQSGDVATKLEKLNAALNASKIEQEKLKTELAQSKAMNEEARKQQGEQAEELEKMVLAISQMQTKLKISPTLHEQMQQPAGAAAAPAAPAATASATAPTPAGTAAKPGSQVQALKEALEKFNKK